MNETLRERIEKLPSWPPYGDFDTMTMDRYVSRDDVLAALASEPAPASGEGLPTGSEREAGLDVERLRRAIDRTLPFERWINVEVVASIARAYESDEPR